MSEAPLDKPKTKWKTVLLSQISTDVSYGYTASSSSSEVGPRMLRITDIQDNSVNWNEVPFCKIDEASIEKYLLKENDIVFARTGATVGKSFLILKDVKNSVFASYLIRVRLADGTLPKYITYFFQSGNYWNQISQSASGIGQPNVNGAKLKKLVIPLAPLEQQKLIVAKIEELFSHIDTGIAALNKSKRLLKQYRQSVLKTAVTGELTKQWREDNKDKLEPASELLERILIERDSEYSRKTTLWESLLKEWRANGEQGKKPARPQKYKNLTATFENSEKLPTGWCWAKLGNLAVDVFDGPFGSNLKSSDYVDEGVRVIRLENIGNLEFKDEKVTYVTEEKYQLLKKHTVTAGDIIFSSFVIGGTRAVVLPDSVSKAINKADCFCIRAFGHSTEAEYLAAFFATTSTYKQLANQVHGATRPRINTTQLKELEVPVCSAEEQKAIIVLVREKFEAIERLGNSIETQLAKAQKTKQSILASAFSGKLV